MAEIKIIPPRVPMVDLSNGEVGRVWYRFISDVAKQSGTNEDSVSTVDDRTTALEGRADAVEPRVDDLEDRETTLEGRADDIESDIGAINTSISNKEDKANKVTSLSAASTDTQYPSAKLAHGQLAGKEPNLPATPSDPGSKILNGNRQWADKIGTDLHYTKWGTDGHQTMAGDARPWRDELTDALNIKSLGAGVSVNNTENVVEITDSAAFATDYLFLNIQLNHDKDLSSPVYPHIHFFQSNAATPNFILQYRWQVNIAAKVTSWTNLKCNLLAIPYTSGTINQIAYALPIDVPVGSSLSDILQFRISRDTGNVSGLFTGADAYIGPVGVCSFDVHFMLNSIGSNEEYSKN